MTDELSQFSAPDQLSGMTEAPGLYRYDPVLILDLEPLVTPRLPGVPEGAGARDRVLTAVTNWLLRRADGHRAGTGPQILALMAATRSPALAAQALDDGALGTPRQFLEALAGVLGTTADALLECATRDRAYDKCVPGDTPAVALRASASAFAGFLNHTVFGPYHRGRNLEFADQLYTPVQVYSHTVRYYCAPLRAAVLRALVAAWVDAQNAPPRPMSTRGEEAPPLVLDRVLLAAQSGTSTFEHLDGSPAHLGTYPDSRCYLGLVLAEAIDDVLYSTKLARDASADGKVPAPPAGAAGTAPQVTAAASQPEREDRLSPAGIRLLGLLIDRTRYPGRDLPAVRHNRETVLAAAEAPGQSTRRCAGPTPSAPPTVATAVHSPRVVTTGGETTLATVGYPFAAVIVPSFTPLEKGVDDRTLDPVNKLRLRKAAEAYCRGLAPVIVVSGAPVYPVGTRADDATMMLDFLTGRRFRGTGDGDVPIVPAECIVADPVARHSTTNLRNSARLLLAAGRLGPYLITTGGEDNRADAAPAFIGGTVGIVAAGAAVTVGLAAAAAAETNTTNRNWLIAGAVANTAVTAVVAGVMVAKANNQDTFDQSSYFRMAKFRERCVTDFGYALHQFIGSPAAYLDWVKGLDDAAVAAAGEDAPIVAAVRAKHQAMPGRYADIPDDDHNVYVPTFKVAYRFSVRDPLDP